VTIKDGAESAATFFEAASRSWDHFAFSITIPKLTQIPLKKRCIVFTNSDQAIKLAAIKDYFILHR